MPLLSPPPVDMLCDEGVPGDCGRLVRHLALTFTARPGAFNILLLPVLL